MNVRFAKHNEKMWVLMVTLFFLFHALACRQIEKVLNMAVPNDFDHHEITLFF